MKTKMPFGVQFSRAVNTITIVIDFIIVILISIVTLTAFIGRYSSSGGYSNYLLVGILLILLVILFSVPAVLLILINRQLIRLNPMARVWQIIVSCILLFLFPIGTLLNGIILYFMFFDKTTKEAFEPQSADENTDSASPLT